MDMYEFKYLSGQREYRQVGTIAHVMDLAKTIVEAGGTVTHISRIEDF